jgi:hypothetical protein
MHSLACRRRGCNLKHSPTARLGLRAMPGDIHNTPHRTCALGTNQKCRHHVKQHVTAPAPVAEPTGEPLEPPSHQLSTTAAKFPDRLCNSSSAFEHCKHQPLKSRRFAAFWPALLGHSVCTTPRRVWSGSQAAQACLVTKGNCPQKVRNTSTTSQHLCAAWEPSR